jgi:hypothetical protein
MTKTAAKSPRIPALDFTKGSLVLIMVLYHWINYFYGGQDQRYLRFLTPSFIFISGFIVSNIYFSKYGISDPKLPMRLIQRGLKILGVFVALNVTRSFLDFGRSHGQSLSSENLIKIYLLGTGVGGGQAKAVAFFILVPISYLLILSSLLLIPSRHFRYTFHVVCLIFLACAFVSNSRGFEIPNLELVAIGLLGVVAGYLPIEKVNTAVRHPFFLVLAYLAYLAAITEWNVIYPLQIVGVYLSLMILYLVGQQSGGPGKGWATVVLLGKYSLFGYIVQIAILQALRVGLNHFGSRALVLGLSFVLAFALTIISVAFLDWGREKSTALDKSYRAIFA